MIRAHRSLAWRLGLAALAALTSAHCHRGAAPAVDAGTDSGSNDGTIPLTLAIAVTGCRSYSVDSSGGHCAGGAPLAVSLSPVSSPDFVRFTWSFGDGTPDASDRAPEHTYALPGQYTVILTGVLAQGGTVQTGAAIAVDALSVGDACDVDAQCAAGLTCACRPGALCPAAFARGVCSTACASADCPSGGVCAALALGTPAAPSCVAGCGAGCPAGLTCASLVGAGAAAGTWVRGCLPIGALADVGSPCRDANGNLDDGACATGVCADLGALGACTAPCSSAEPCPTGTACARLADGRSLCLADCSVAGACLRDPLLACTAPDAGADGGAGAFQADAAAGATFCAPKPCATDMDCAPSGRCAPNGACASTAR